MIDGDISESEEKSITALGLLNTMETILTVMEDQKEVRDISFKKKPNIFVKRCYFV